MRAGLQTRGRPRRLTSRPRIPSHISLDSAALLEPLSVAIHAVRRSFIEQGDTVAVYGAGAIGLLVAAMAKLSGATTVVISDIDSGRVEYALRNGFATKGYVNTKTSPLTELSDKLAAAKATAADVVDIAFGHQSDAEGVDVTFECTGKEICMQAGLYVSLLLSNPTSFGADHVCRRQGQAVSLSWLGWERQSKLYHYPLHI